MVFERTSYAYYFYSRLRSIALFWIGRLLPAQRPEFKDLSGKTALVTGSNVGIGLEIARGLASRGATVVLACRNREKAEKAKKDIIERSGGRIRDEQVEVMLVDVSDLSSVRALVKEWGTRSLDILINNAGMMTGTFTKSPQGYEQTYTTNILSHYLLTLLLLPRMPSNGRIVNTSSSFHYDATTFDVLDLDWSKHFEAQGLKEGGPIEPGNLTLDLYIRSKCLQIMFARELQQRLEQSEAYRRKGITVHSYNPGLTRSTLWARDNVISLPAWSKKIGDSVFNVLGTSTTEGAATAIHLCVSDDAAKTPGLYWHHMSVTGTNRIVEDASLRKLIFDQMAVEAGLEDHLRL
ncbi:hypothetical protein DL96DRAFT_1676453 [Flagelloscypha sp. PMI_526]|nr:hypothetical protein DL96DRAFT_1676453 [Flagelloscypha sp. PMI_526]